VILDAEGGDETIWMDDPSSHTAVPSFVFAAWRIDMTAMDYTMLAATAVLWQALRSATRWLHGRGRASFGDGDKKRRLRCRLHLATLTSAPRRYRPHATTLMRGAAPSLAAALRSTSATAADINGLAVLRENIDDVRQQVQQQHEQLQENSEPQHQQQHGPPICLPHASGQCSVWRRFACW